MKIARRSVTGLMRSVLPESTRKIINRVVGRNQNLVTSASQPLWGDVGNFDFKNLPYFRRDILPEDKGPQAWLDRSDSSAAILKKLSQGLLTEDEARACETFAKDGVYIARGLLDEAFVEDVFEDYLQGLKTNQIQLSPGDRRFLNPHFHIPRMKDLLEHPNIVKQIELFLGQSCIPFQTIASEFGSGQLEHSDAIHMTTFPLGYMAAAWVACEDIHPDSGPLFYYPGTHKLPYYLSKEVGISYEDFQLNGYRTYTSKYEPFIQDLILSKKLTPMYFEAKKGDVLFWHHNVIHGGSPIKNGDLTRKAVVNHYFARGVLCYHDLASSATHLGSATYE